MSTSDNLLSADALLSQVNLNRADIYELFFLRRDEIGVTVEFLRQLAVRHQLSPYPSALDVGCGTGRMIPPLRALGWQVSGVEPDAVYRARAARYASMLGAQVFAGSFTRLPKQAPQALIFSINGPLSYVLSWDERLAALDACFAALQPGGWLLLDLPNFLFMLRRYQAPAPQQARYGGFDIRRSASHDFDFHEARWLHHEHVEWRVAGDEKAAWSGYDELYTFAIISPPELFALLAQAGFINQETFAGWADPTPRRLAGPRIIVAAQRPLEAT